MRDTDVLVKGLLQSGDPSDRRFREICYSASRNTVDKFLHDNPQEAAGQLRAGLEETIRKTEASYASRRTVRFSDATKNSLASFGVGLTLFVLVGWFLQQIGLLYVHTSPEGFRHLKEINDSTADLRPIADDAISALRVGEANVTKALKETRDMSKAHGHFVSIRELFPEVYANMSKKLPYDSGMIVRITDDNTGYKLLIQSEVCGAILRTHPEMVDPVRKPYDVFCRYFGLWNEAGKAL